MGRALAALVVGAVVLVGATTAHGQDRLTRNPAPPIARVDPGIGSTLGYGGPPATSSSPQPTDRISVSSSPSSDDPAGPLGSGAGIIVLVAIGGAFLLMRARALRR